MSIKQTKPAPTRFCAGAGLLLSSIQAPKRQMVKNWCKFEGINSKSHCGSKRIPFVFLYCRGGGGLCFADGEYHLPVHIGFQPVPALDGSAPAVVAADAHLAAQDPDPGVMGSGQLVNVHGLLQLIAAVGQDTAFEGSILRLEAQAEAVVVRYLQPAGAHAVATFAGDHVAGQVGSRVTAEDA